MKLLVKKDEVNVIQENPVSKFFEYGLSFNKLSVGVSEINGRYPEKGYDVDSEVEAVWYVESGSGQINIMQEVYDVEPGDMIMIPKGEKFWIDGKILN